MDTVKITYLGQCGFLIEGGGTRLVTDPYLSDCVDRLLFSEATPWKRLYPAPARLIDLAPDVIVISHAHIDHMDPDTIGDYLASGGSAEFAAPAPEVHILRKLGVKAVIEARAEQPFTARNVAITPIACAHTQLHTDEQGRFRELSYIIELCGNRIFFGGDMSLYDGLAGHLGRADCDLLLLPVNGRDEERTAKDIIGNTDCNEAAALSARLNVPFVPMHHDLYAINGCLPGAPEAAAKDAGTRVISIKPTQAIEMRGGAIV